MNLETGTRAHSGNRGDTRGWGSSVNLLYGLNGPSRIDVSGRRAHRFSSTRERARQRPFPSLVTFPWATDRALSAGFDCHGGCLGRAAYGRTLTRQGR